jgi:hypothetical protein
MLAAIVFYAKLFAAVLTDFVMITFLDYAPNSIRRSVLKNEYEGEALEERLKMKIGGGWTMFRELWRMASVNMRPSLAVGDQIPTNIPLVSCDKRKSTLELSTLAQVGRPLVLNFGSCS